MDWNTPIDELRRVKSATAADERLKRAERHKIENARLALYHRTNKGLPVANPCPTEGCTLKAWEHPEACFPCSPGQMWVPVLRSTFPHKILVAAMAAILGSSSGD